jgi:hypothetical protein
MKYASILLTLTIIHLMSIAQEKKFPLYGVWTNTQLDLFKNLDSNSKLKYNIQPWTIAIDTLGKYFIETMFESGGDFGFPIKKDTSNGLTIYIYKAIAYAYIYSIGGNDSLLIYNNKCGIENAGIIFRKMK